MHTLKQLGYDHYQAKTGASANAPLIARISAEFGTSFTVLSPEGELTAIAGKTLITSTLAANRPKVGDWVTYEPIPGEDKVRIEDVLPRYSELARKQAGKRLEAQVLAANVDVVCIMESLETPFDGNRIERFLVVPESSGTDAVILLSKADAVTKEARAAYLTEATKRFPTLTILETSTATGEGISELQKVLPPGYTGVIIGPSGVGKSSLVNKIIGEQKLATGSVQIDSKKGKHTTTRRELLVLPWGAILIDTPGMRELQLWGDSDTTFNAAFSDIEALALTCKFSDCDHVKSAGCALQAAVKDGSVDEARLLSFLKLKRELHHHAAKINYEAKLTKKKREKKLTQNLRTIVRTKRGKH